MQESCGRRHFDGGSTAHITGASMLKFPARSPFGQKKKVTVSGSMLRRKLYSVNTASNGTLACAHVSKPA